MMKAIVKRPQEITITHIKIRLPVNYGEEDIPNDFPLRSGDVWEARVNIDTGKIENWPDDPRFRECSLDMKVCDGGTYVLYSYFGDYWDEIAKQEQEYVPHGVIPGEYGDYVELHIKNGVITNWPEKPDVRVFFGEDCE